MPNSTYDQAVKNLSATLKAFSEAFIINSLPIEKIRTSMLQVVKSIASYHEVFSIADKLADHQFVLTQRIPAELIERSKAEELDDLADEFFSSDRIIEQTINECGLDNNLSFTESIQAFRQELYNLAIIGLTAVLDRVLSEYSGDIERVNIKKRSEAIKKSIEEKGEFFLDEMEGMDYLLYLTYPKVAESFGLSSSFISSEPDALNRHWIMHGRTDKSYTRLDCVKVLNLIYGTIRLGQLGREDA